MNKLYFAEYFPIKGEVKEDDEFCEDDIFPIHSHDEDGKIVYKNLNGEIVTVPIFTVKGPCGHFH